MTIQMRQFSEADSAAVLALNAASVAVLSPLDPERLALLGSLACLHLVAENATGVVGFLLAFADGVAYDSINYQWFSSRFKRFLYIDRVVVGSTARGMGVGQGLYRHAQIYARSNELAWLVCEVDIEPPNPGSLAFHQRLGFVEVGRQMVGSNKVVSLQALAIGVPANK